MDDPKRPSGRPRDGLVRALNALGEPRSLVVIVATALAAFWFAFAIFASVVPVGSGLMNRYGGVAGGDFMFFYSVGVLVHEGQAGQVYDAPTLTSVGRAKFGPDCPELVWPYPPTMSLPLSLLGRFPPGAAMLVWMSLCFGSLLLLARVTMGSWPLAPVVLLFPGSAFALFAGQFSSALALFLAVAVRYVASSTALAGVALGLFVWKPHFALVPVLFMFLERRWRAVAAAAAVAGAIVLLSIGVFGTDVWLRFLDAGLQQSTTVHRDAPIGRFVTMFGAAYTWGATLRTALLLHAVLALVTLGFGWSLWRREVRGSMRALGLVATTLLVPPYALDYDLVFLAIPWLLMIRECGEDPQSATALFWPWLALTGLVPVSHIFLLLASHSIAGPMLFAILGVSWWKAQPS